MGSATGENSDWKSSLKESQLSFRWKKIRDHGNFFRSYSHAKVWDLISRLLRVDDSLCVGNFFTMILHAPKDFDHYSLTKLMVS